MSKLIRKISVGKNYKTDAMHYAVGQEVYGGHIICDILEDDLKYSIFIKKNNDVLIYDFINDEVSNPYETLFNDYDIREKFEGLVEIGKNGSIFIEQSVSGRAMQFDKKGNLIWEYVNRAKNNNLYRLNWSRIIGNIDDDFLAELKKLNCD